MPKLSTVAPANPSGDAGGYGLVFPFLFSIQSRSNGGAVWPDGGNCKDIAMSARNAMNATEKMGTVTLVGAGPGDPELLKIGRAHV